MAKQRGLPTWEQIFGLQERSAVFSRHYHDILKKVFLNRENENKKTFLVTSAVASEGKTFTAVNLAAVLARSGRTLLVDANFLNPMSGVVFGIAEGTGLAEVLTNRAELKDALMINKDLPNLHLLIGGSQAIAAVEMFSPACIGNFIETIKSSYRYILFDGSAVKSTNDSLVLSSVVDGTFLVVRSDSTQKEELLSARFNIEKYNGNIAGVVLNRVPRYVPSFYRTV
ncbi:MAG: CpsD/CapB family tyrosine-protein kinase [Deltaproteobacteria bacterium]|nr:CpsD/CapB family tyrosine-protein kinase [Deltaproteobacteria bacterium]